MVYSRCGWLLLALFSLMPLSSAGAVECAFANPIVSLGQDPSVVFHDGFYYLVQSNAGQLTIARSSTLTSLGRAEPVVVFAPPPGEVYSYDMWAPELFHYNDAWYIYIAATSAPGANATHRMYVLQADTADPQGSWTMKGKIYDPAADKWAIDGVVFEYGGQLYMVWSGWPGDQGDFPQNLYIAPMSDPLTLSGGRVLLSEPEELWERSVAAIQEGPQVFIHDGQLSIVYSANASWTTAYSLGLLKLTGNDPLNPAAWEKIGPVFSGYTSDRGNVYGVGHNSNPVPSPDGSESWLIYHTKTLPTNGWGDRAIAAQKFTWNADGTPHFGQPIPLATGIPIPAGEPCGLVAGTETLLAAQPLVDGALQLEQSFVDTGQSWLDTLSSFSVAVRVRLDDLAEPAAILSQDGGISSNFALEYTGETLAFTRYDPFGRQPVSALATIKPQAGQWYHLVGVYDIAAAELRLYVDGELQATAAAPAPWDARGSVILGAARAGSKRVKPLTGQIRDVQLYKGVLTADEVKQLAGG